MRLPGSPGELSQELRALQGAWLPWASRVGRLDCCSFVGGVRTWAAGGAALAVSGTLGRVCVIRVLE